MNFVRKIFIVGIPTGLVVGMAAGLALPVLGLSGTAVPAVAGAISGVIGTLFLRRHA